MSELLPILFAVAGGVALLVFLGTFWQSVRAAFGVGPADAVAQTYEGDHRSSLRDEKHALLQSIKDLEFERQVGKLSEDDFGSLDRRLRGRARDVLRLLDEDVEPFRVEAERLVAEHLRTEEGGAAPYRAAAAEAGVASEPPVARRECETCGASNEADAAFCKKCAAPLAAGAAARSADAEPAAATPAPAESVAAGSEGADATDSDATDSDATGSDATGSDATGSKEER